MDSYHKAHRQTSSTSIGKISIDLKEEFDEEKYKEEQQIDEVINESSWVAGKTENKMASAPSFGDLMAEEQTKKKQRKKKSQPANPSYQKAIERPVPSNQPLRQQEPYPENESIEGEEVWDSATGKKTFIPYVKEEPADVYYDDGNQDFADDDQQGGYGGRDGYGRSSYGRGSYNRRGGGHGYRNEFYEDRSGGYGNHSYSKGYGNQFYDSGNVDDYQGYRGRSSGRAGNSYYGGRKQQPQPKISATEKYGDYTKKADGSSPDSSKRTEAPIFELGRKAQPTPPPIVSTPKQQPQPQPQSQPTIPTFNPVRKQPDPPKIQNAEKPVEKQAEKEEEWNPDDEGNQ